jgi:D-serine deaminase-like pyridoxal phosphate-dependent protein
MNAPIPVMIEIDCDGERGGVRPDDPALIDIAQLITRRGAELRGVMTHAGSAYQYPPKVPLESIAEHERRAAVESAERLRASGLPCPVVSVGSTPTAHFARHLDDVTEVRAGVFPFFDLINVGLGVCSMDDIALSVLATVIGHRSDKSGSILDAGWMAMSRDAGNSRTPGYGLVCDLAGRSLKGLFLQELNQEHGIVGRTIPAGDPMPALGAKVRILPNHACATAAQHDHYVVVGAESQIRGTWSRFSGW